MTKLYLAGIFSLLFTLGFSQIPQGMNYQAVARDKNGNELANTPISLQITLYSPQAGDTFYTETHSVTTNQFGLFSLVIGQGTVGSGIFANIPWSQDEIWMSVAEQVNGQGDFTPLGSSKLYAVPYAFAAGTANSVTQPVGVDNNPNNGQCPCNGGITSLTVLYLGPSGVTIRVYNNSALQNTGLIATFTPVSNGAVLTINVPPSCGGGTLQNQTYFQYSGIPNPPAVTTVPTNCSSNYSALNPASPGGTWGNISVISQTDQTGETCTACNVSGLWYVGGNAVLAACNQLGTLTNNDLVLISNNTPRMVVTAGGDVDVNNNLNVGQGLNVTGNTNLTGPLTSNGPFTVAGNSPTTLTGSLTTDGASVLNNTLTVNGVTNLNANLDVNNMQSTDLTGTLTVGRATLLDSALAVYGNTDLYGYLHVDKQAPAVFTGTLAGYLNATFNQQVLLDNASLNSSSTTTGALVVAGGTGIGQTLYVGGPSFLLNTLSVASNSDLYGYLHVNNQQPTVLTGTLADSLDATFAHHVTLTNGGIGSTTPYNGALVVAGGVGIGQNLNVEGASTFHGPVQFGSVVTFSDTVNSTSYTNGTIVDDGGAGIAENLNVNGAVGFNSTLNVIGAAQLQNTLTVNGTSLFNRNVTINAIENGDHSNPAEYPLTVEGSNQGIRIEVRGAHSGGTAGFDNDYIQFVDSTGTARGAITGETQADLNSDPAYIAQQTALALGIVVAGYSIYSAQLVVKMAAEELAATTTQLQAVTDQVGDATLGETEAVTTEIGDDAATTPCVGLGVCETAPPPSDIAAGVANVIEAGVGIGVASAAEAEAVTDETLASTNVALAGGGLTTAIANEAKAALALTQFNATTALEIPGIYFKSGNGDYAEWLPKANADEKIYRGDVVGVKGGLISKSTEGAEKLMVVSTMPIVLGNAPPEGKEAAYEKVAFIGQVKVKVFGKAEPGDYIICTGGASGFGVSRHPADMTTEDYQKIVGIAWEGSKAEGLNYVNTAVGLNTNDAVKLAVKQEATIKAQQDEINTLKKQMSDVTAEIAKLAPGFNSAPSIGTNTVYTTPNSPVASSTTNYTAVSPTTSNPAASSTANAPVAPAASANIVPGSKRYLELTREDFDKGVQIAIEHLRKAGLTPEKNEALKKLMEDPAYKDQLFAEFQERQQKEIAKRQQMNLQSSH